MKNIVIFASGTGSNAENIIHYFKKHTSISVVAIFSNNGNAKVLEKAKKLDVPTVTFNKDELYGDFAISKLNTFKPDLIILAGFLLKFPEQIIAKYSNQIINIHPALLPKYGGKGMYGKHVHQAVLDNKETETGITIHFVNEQYDEGGIIFQKSISIADCSSADEIATKVHELEYHYFPRVIDQLLTSNFK
jgi:phosphoribosylglycinamide formyltransferase-1